MENKFNYVAVGEYVVVESLESDKDVGGITVVGKEEDLCRGRVLSAGDEADDAIGLFDGLEVLYLKKEAKPIGLGHNKNVMYLHYSKIIAVEPCDELEEEVLYVSGEDNV